jgi:hypothetical protein
LSLGSVVSGLVKLNIMVGNMQWNKPAHLMVGRKKKGVWLFFQASSFFFCFFWAPNILDTAALIQCGFYSLQLFRLIREIPRSVLY